MTSSADLTVSVYVRPGLLTEPIDAKIRTLQRLETDRVIDSVQVDAWPDEVQFSERTPSSDVIDLFDRFATWADQNGATIRPPFVVQTRTSHITGETRTVLVTPVMCLVVYVGDRLATVYPHAKDDVQYSVTDAIAALETDDLDILLSEFEPVLSAAATR